MRSNLWVSAAAAALLAFCMAPAFAQDADQPGDASTQAVLSGNIDGQISPAGDVDWFRLQVEVGQRYNLALVGIEVEGQAIDPMLSVYDAQGNQLAFNDDANDSLNSALRYAPAASGEVFIEARAFSAEATGPYRLGVSSEALPADDVGNDASTRARVSAGRNVSGNIEYEGDFDWYRLPARTGNRYRVTLAGASEGGLGDPVLRVIDREGNEIAANDDSGEGSFNSALEFVPSANGDVFVEARGYGDSQTGRYDLAVATEHLPRDSVGNSRASGATIRAGQTRNSTLDFPSDTDWYRIRLVEGQSYRFTLNSDGATALDDPLLRLHNSRGEELAVDDDGGDGLNAYLEFTATNTGTYFVEARGFADDATGGYALTAHEGDIPADNSTDASLGSDGDYREATLSPANDRDWYRLELTEGQGVRLGLNSAATPDALQDPMIVLYGPDGAEVARDDDGGDGLNSWLEYQAAAAGTYYVEARGFVDEATGRYALTVAPGEIAASPDGAESLSATGDPRTALIGADGDVDWFVVELIEGRPYRINVESMDPDPLADPMLTIYDAQGERVVSDDDGGRGLNAYLNFASATGGPYFLAVSSFGDTGAGRYQIRVADTDVPGHAYTDELLDAADDARASRIEMPGDIDAYRVTLEAGVTYAIEVNGARRNGLADPFVAIVNEENTRIASDDDSGPGANARLRFRPPNSGDYVIQASGLGGSIGDYEVKIVRR